MAAEKWLTVVVDGTAAMGPYWKSILSDYLEKIIRNICGQSSADQDASAGTAVYLGLVQYNSHGLGNTGCLMRASPWTRNMEGFLECLSALHFSGGGGLNEAAIAEGLVEALVMFPKPTPTGTGTGTGIGTGTGTGTETNTETGTCQVQDHYTRERHCILVAASNPMLTPTYIQIPMISNGQFSSGTETRLTLADAEDVAKLYAECSVSLSLISPKQFPKLREIYNAGRNDPESEGVVSSFRNVKYPHFLVLISNKFSEARAALDHSQTVIKSQYNVFLSKRYTDDPERTPSFSNANNPDVLVLLSKDFSEARAALLQYTEVSRQLAYIASDLLEDNKDFEYVGDMMDLLETDEQDCRKGNIFNETRELLLLEHVAQCESLKQAPLIISGSLVSDASHPCSASTIDLTFSDLPELFKGNCDFESVGDMLDLLETCDQNHRAGNTPDETREIILVEHDAQDGSLSQAPLSFSTVDHEIMSGSFVSDTLPFSASTIKFSDVPGLFEDNNDFESVGDMLDLLDTYEKDHREENFPDETREMLLVEHVTHDDSLSQAPLSSATSDIISGSLVSDASLPSSAASTSTIQADLPSPKHAQQILAIHDMSGVHQSQGSTEDPSSPQTTTSSDASETSPDKSRVPRASSRTRTSKISKSHFQPRSPRISSRATVEQRQVGALGRSGEPSSDTSLSVQTRPPRKGSKHLAASPVWKEDVYELAWKGIMLAKHQGRLLIVNKAQAYKTTSAPKSLTAAWRRLLMVGDIIPQSTVSRSNQGQTNDLIFEIMDNPEIHNILHKKELCIRYSMPTQLLIITPAELNYFTGRVYAVEGAYSTKGATFG